MKWALAASLLFCGWAMMADGRVDGEREREQPGGGAALFVAGLIVGLSGVFVLLSAAQGAWGAK